MRILIIMAGFFPGKKYGGPPVSIDNFCSLMDEDDCFIVTCNHDLGSSEPYKGIEQGWNDRSNCRVLYVSETEYKKKTFDKVISEIRPDVLYLQGLFQSCILPCLQLAKKHNISVLLAPRGELCEGALNIKKWKKLPYIEAIKALGLVKNIHWQSTSEEETEAIKKIMKPGKDNIHYLDNIPSIPKTEYPRHNKVAGEGRFVFLSRIHPKKNLLSAIRFFENINGKVWFDIYGPIEDEYWKQCKEEINKLPETIKVEYKGLVGHEKVHEVFSQYDAFLFPTLSENYGHVIAESLIVGTPVIISDQTPWDDLEENKAGWAIPLSDVQSFGNSIKRIIEDDDAQMRSTSASCKEYVQHRMNIASLKAAYLNTIRSV